MTNLQNRVQKSKSLKFREVGGAGKILATVGSQDDHYQIEFSHHIDSFQFGDQQRNVRVFEVNCEKINTGNGKLNPMEPCRGNCRHTVCYHCLGGLRHIFKQDNKAISFYDNIFSAITGTNLGGKIAKIETPNKGSVWAVVRKTPIKVENSPIVNLMRGEEDEGID